MQVRLFGIILNLLKEMRHDIFGDADALVDHTDDSIASLSFRKDLHRTVRRCETRRVGQQNLEHISQLRTIAHHLQMFIQREVTDP